MELTRRFGLLAFFLQATDKEKRVYVLRQFDHPVTFGLTCNDGLRLFEYVVLHWSGSVFFGKDACQPLHVIYQHGGSVKMRPVPPLRICAYCLKVIFVSFLPVTKCKSSKEKVHENK
jgi:hypothetical protein